jgi:hypothetical protein
MGECLTITARQFVVDSRQPAFAVLTIAARHVTVIVALRVIKVVVFIPRTAQQLIERERRGRVCHGVS